MKGRPNAPIIGKLSLFSLVLAGFAAQSQAQSYNLSDGNSSAAINAGNQAGMYNWTVDGQNQLYQQWFWYRVGSAGGESAINTLGLVSSSVSGPNQLTTVFGNSQFHIQVDYLLRGGAVGSGSSRMAESITIFNLGSSPLDMHFFQYSDFDLLGSTGGDTVALGRDTFGRFNEALQTKGGLSSPYFTESVLTTGADHGEVDYYPNTLNRLNDANPTTLNDNVGPIGPGDVTWAFEWDLTIAGNGSALISKDKNLTVPEPSVLALVALGLGALVLRRRSV